MQMPKRGDRVQVLRGEHVDAEFTVVDVRGNAFMNDMHVFVDADHETPVWYHPWDLRIL